MFLETRSHREALGWSSALPATLDSDRTVVFAFGAPKLEGRPGALHELRQAFPRARILGCSTAGEIHQERVLDDSVAVAIARFEEVTSHVVSVPIGDGHESFAAGAEIADRLRSTDLRAIFVLSEGLAVNGSELVRGINAGVPPGVLVTGGLAGDGERFQHTWVFDGQHVSSRRAVAIGFSGERLAVAHGSKGGWDIFGPERRVTKSEGNVLYELDGKPALKLYKDYLGDRAAGLPATALLFPLAVRRTREDTKQLVRTVLSVNEEKMSLTFAGDVPMGALAQLMRANFDRLIQGASDAATLARAGSVNTGPALALAISCVGRRLVLGSRTDEELEATLDELPRQARQIGFYSYGEISPFAHGACDLHNQTMTLTTYAERA